MGHYFARSVLGVCAAFFAAAAPAFADGPVSVYAGSGLLLDGDQAQTVQAEFSAGYDFGPKLPVVPIRVRADVDYAFGIANNVSSTSQATAFGVGLSARLTTPFYFGAGASIYNVNLHENFAYPAVVPIDPGFDQSFPKTSTTGLGGGFFVGQCLVSSKAFGLAVEASYKFLPSVGTQNLSSFGIGLRANT